MPSSSRLVHLGLAVALVVAPPVHKYRFTVEYFNFDATGTFLQKQRIVGEYHEGRLVGRSDYWGDIWVSLATGDTEHATLYEHVAGELQLSSRPAPQLINVVRKGTFERLAE